MIYQVVIAVGLVSFMFNLILNLISLKKPKNNSKINVKCLSMQWILMICIKRGELVPLGEGTLPLAWCMLPPGFEPGLPE